MCAISLHIFIQQLHNTERMEQYEKEQFKAWRCTVVCPCVAATLCPSVVERALLRKSYMRQRIITPAKLRKMLQQICSQA